MKTKGNLFMAIFFLLLGLYGIIQSLTFRYWESMVLPLAVSSIIFIMASVQVGRELYQQYKRRATSELKNHQESGIELRRFFLVSGWTTAFILGIYLLGFMIAIPLFSFSYLKWRRRSWITAAVFSVVLLGIIYGIFVLGLNVPIFKGIIFGG